jgi:hypothetical protein
LKLFLSQKALEEWSMADKADLQSGQLVVKEGGVASHPSYPVVPAVHFVRIVSGEDVKSLVGRVKTLEQVHAFGAEHLADSVILGDAAYEVLEGYVTEVQTPVGPKGEAKKKPTNPEADLLAAFILDKL